MKSATKISP